MFNQVKSASLGLALVLITLPAQATTLADALVQAYQGNPQLLAQQAALRASDEGVLSARANLLPILSQTLNLRKTKDFAAAQPQSSSASSLTSQWTLNTQLAIQLFDGGADKLSVEAERMIARASRQALLSIEQSILFDTVQAYMNVRRDQQFVRLAKNNLIVLRKQVRAAKDRFDVGEVTLTDVAQAETRLAAAVSQLEANKGNLQRSTNSYAIVVGSEPRDLRDPPPAPKIPDTVAKAEVIAITRHPRVLQAQFNAKAAELVSQSTSKNYFPTINGQLDYSIGSKSGTSELTTDEVSLGLVGRWTLYQGGRLNSGRRRDVARHQQALFNVQQSGLLTRQGVRNAFTNWEVAKASIISNREQVRAAQVAYEGVREEADLGARTTLDVLDAEQELLSTRSQLVTAMRDQYVAQYQVLAEMGLLNAEHLGLGVPIYNPGEHSNVINTGETGTIGTKRNRIFDFLKKRNRN